MTITLEDGDKMDQVFLTSMPGDVDLMHPRRRKHSRGYSNRHMQFTCCLA
jgi:hypothetical protein